MTRLDHKSSVLMRLRRIEGQVRGLQRMVEAEAPCAEILTQVAAVTSATKKVSMAIVQAFMEECLAKADRAGEDKQKNFKEFHRALSRYIDWA